MDVNKVADTAINVLQGVADIVAPELAPVTGAVAGGAKEAAHQLGGAGNNKGVASPAVLSDDDAG